MWAAYWVLLFGATHVPVPGAGRPLLPHLDKLVHAVIYFLLTWLGGRHLLARGTEIPTRSLLWWAAAYAVYAALDEWLQQFVSRTMSLGDWLADVAGIAGATLMLARRSR